MSRYFNILRPVVVGLLTVGLVVAGTVWLRAQGGPRPSFGPLSISPPSIVYNTPTLVTFTVTIDAPTLNQNTVELQRVDASGNYITTLSKMSRVSGGASNGKTFTAVNLPDFCG